jgi:hypothetical protein
MRWLAGCFLVARLLSGQDAWHHAHDLGNRYEGLIDVQTGNPPLEILSFTAAVKLFEGAEEWRVRFFTDTPQSVVVYACDVNDEAQYRMESKPVPSGSQQWSEFKMWDTGAVLVKQKVKPTSVGVKVLGSGGAYLPAIVYPAKAEFPQIIKTYLLQMRASRTVDRVECVVHGTDLSGKQVAQTCTSNGEHEGNFSFPLQINVEKFSAGPMSIALRLMNRSTPVSSAELKFYHHPRTAN